MNEIAYPQTQFQRYSSRQINKVTYYCQSLNAPDKDVSEKKNQIYKWLRNLPTQQLEQVLSFTSYYRVHSFLKMFKQDQNLLHEYFELAQSPYEVNVKIKLHQYYYVRECNRIDMNAQWRSAQQYILDHTYISDYEWLFDTITIKGNVEEIIQSFEILSKQQIFTKSWRIETNEDEEYSEINFDSQQNQKMFWTLSEHIVNEIEKAILIKFQQFEQKCTYTKQDQLFNFHQIELNFNNINYEGETQEFQKVLELSQGEMQFIDEKVLLQSWLQHIKCESLSMNNAEKEIQHFLQEKDLIFQSPLKYIITESLLFCKYLICKQLKNQFPLKKPVEENLKEKKKPKQKLSDLKLFQNPVTTPVEDQSLKQVVSYFSNSGKSKILPETEQRLFSTNLEEKEQQIYEHSTGFMKKLIETVLIELENFKQYKKKLKKVKNTKKQQVIEVVQPEPSVQQESQNAIKDDEWNDKPKSKKQRKKQLEKQRKKENLERKKLKQMNQSQQHSVQDDEKIEKSSKSSIKDDNEDIENQNENDSQHNNNEELIVEEQQKNEIIEKVTQEIPIITNSVPDDESDYIEVQNKKQQKKQSKSKSSRHKKQSNKKDKEFQDNQSLPDEQQYIPLLKKSTSQSVQKNNHHQYDELKLERMPSQQQNRITLQKKENGMNKIQRSGLVKSKAQQKEQKLYTYDLDQAHLQKIYKTILEQKITNDVKQIYQKEIDQFNRYKAARDISIQRVQHVIKSYFKNCDTQIFGSSTTGLALKDSDVDMVVYGLQVFTKQQLFEPMRRLIEIFTELKWAVQCKHIFQASVPLIKVLVDPSIDFLSFKGEPKYIIMQCRNLDLNLKYGDPSQHIFIDITFELAPSYAIYNPYIQAFNIGFQSTQFTIDICGKIQGFSEVAIYLKKLLKIKDLNDSYTGGISSFCLTIMLAAIGQDHNIGQKLINFLHKYGCNFDPNKWAIYLDEKEQNNFYNIEDEQSNQPLTIISPINLQKIQINVTKIQTILQLFQQLYVEIMQNIDQIESCLQKRINQKELLENYNSHQISKLVDLVSWQCSNLLESHIQ
ncbi:unnamed protein product [Paramecium octaurelia]|uniref:Poly(A) RNA polymerase mitochondrial-like central palm domain-containing protein n=1 Tax=Paramecium octaurelia TaxID=43137 RepID=A0A8S1UHE2_PAROT|nr:unnamed protein product [Paramecium octaurelia]